MSFLHVSRQTHHAANKGQSERERESESQTSLKRPASLRVPAPSVLNEDWAEICSYLSLLKTERHNPICRVSVTLLQRSGTRAMMPQATHGCLRTVPPLLLQCRCISAHVLVCVLSNIWGCYRCAHRNQVRSRLFNDTRTDKRIANTGPQINHHWLESKDSCWTSALP